MRKTLLTLLLLFFFVFSTYGQNDCGPGYSPCGPDHTCIPESECGGGPPPPGLVLPIDTNIFILVFAGLGLGIYFYLKNQSISSPSN